MRDLREGGRWRKVNKSCDERKNKKPEKGREGSQKGALGRKEGRKKNLFVTQRRRKKKKMEHAFTGTVKKLRGKKRHSKWRKRRKLEKAKSWGKENREGERKKTSGTTSVTRSGNNRHRAQETKRLRDAGAGEKKTKKGGLNRRRGNLPSTAATLEGITIQRVL